MKHMNPLLRYMYQYPINVAMGFFLKRGECINMLTSHQLKLFYFSFYLYFFQRIQHHGSVLDLPDRIISLVPTNGWMLQLELQHKHVISKWPLKFAHSTLSAVIVIVIWLMWDIYGISWITTWDEVDSLIPQGMRNLLITTQPAAAGQVNFHLNSSRQEFHQSGQEIHLESH